MTELEQLRQENAALRGELEKLNGRMCCNCLHGYQPDEYAPDTVCTVGVMVDFKSELAGNFCCAFHKEG